MAGGTTLSSTPAGRFTAEPSGLNRNRYPHQFFSLSDGFIPSTTKEMMRWALYLYSTNPIINQIFRKIAGFITTKIMVSGDADEDKQVVEEFIHDTLKLPRQERRMMIDYLLYGNAFAKFIPPADKYMVCDKCKAKTRLDEVDKWTFKNMRFSGTCPKCGAKGTKELAEEPIKNRKRARLVRINPRYIDIHYNPLTEQRLYIFNVPAAIEQSLKQSKDYVQRWFVETTPLDVIMAIKKKKVIKWNEQEVFHFLFDSASRDDDTFGEIPLLPVFKQTWLLHTHWRAQEAISIEHITPWLLVSPASGGSSDVMHSYDMGRWTNFMRQAFLNWRRDPNYIALSPFPVTQVQLRGDAKALDTFNQQEFLVKIISGGMGVPEGFIFGGMTWSSASVELRALENEWINLTARLEEFIKWVKTKAEAMLDLPKVEIEHQEFKMADDVQQRQQSLQLAAQGVISQQQLCRDLGYDYDEMLREKKREHETDQSGVAMQQKREAQAQAEVLKIQGRVQLELELQRLKETHKLQQQLEAGTVPDTPTDFGNAGQLSAVNAPGRTDTVQIGPMTYSEELLRNMASNFMRTRPTNEMRERELRTLELGDPGGRVLARTIRRYMKEIEAESRKAVMNPLPQQKPGKRSPQNMVI